MRRSASVRHGTMTRVVLFVRSPGVALDDELKEDPHQDPHRREPGTFLPASWR